VSLSLDSQYLTAREVKEAQQVLDLYPDNSPYWNLLSGQDHMDVIRTLGLKRREPAGLAP